ncbi:glycosyltransferase [Mesoterricola silvestris]|uniref:Glycosyl transferase family 1 n=1 Tax=Mesoterricola silvestris TaxID=2927979 RepID=A0AA48KA19_9BACT|nr:glycosyltransferase [Mesoterricola silvestris]BDU71078.1 glycosyl transferase family 1 [Mesoterricola silvestris]
MAYALGYQALGHSVAFLLHPSYKLFKELAETAPILEAEGPGAIDLRSFDLALFYNMAPNNATLARRMKGCGLKVAYVYHEPWESIPTYLRTEGPYSTLKLTLAHRFSVDLLKLSDLVILSSKRAMELYHQGDVRYNHHVEYIPLLLTDECPKGELPERRFVSYIGTICPGHAFDAFVRFMEFAADQDSSLTFLLASRSPTPTSTAFKRALRKLGNRLRVQCGRPLTNEEINNLYLQSVCTWNLYKRTTQSGVLPRAQMLGAPSLASPVGSLPEFMRDGQEGIFVKDPSPMAIMEAASKIRENQDQFSANCRSNFLNTFHFQANLERIRQTL